jgi:hypothetical protein
MKTLISLFQHFNKTDVSKRIVCTFRTEVGVVSLPSSAIDRYLSKFYTAIYTYFHVLLAINRNNDFSNIVPWQ